MNCRNCNQQLTHVFIDLGFSPPSNSFLKAHELNEGEMHYPLKVYVCDKCFLVQLEEFKKSDAIFSDDYVYFSSYSKSWLAHAREYTNKMVSEYNYDSESLVSEIASNDGYLLQYFHERNIPVLGIEPTANTAAVAQELGVETLVEFFGASLALKLKEQGRLADLIIGNNVLAHVPDIIDFVKGLKIYLKENGIITIEFPHLLQLIKENQFDTIYHEHFSYLSYVAVNEIFTKCGLRIFRIEELKTHGGSLRIYACHTNDATKQNEASVSLVSEKENAAGLTKLETYTGFQDKAFVIKTDLIKFLLKAKAEQKTVAAYGAAAKGNTLLNYCGIHNDLIDFVVDLNPNKQNRFLPASHIPVKDEAFLKLKRPDYILILPWNLVDEIKEQLHYIAEWGGQFVIPIPEVKLL